MQAVQAFGAPQLIFNYTQGWEDTCVPSSNFTDACSIGVFQEEVLPLWPQPALRQASVTRTVRTWIAVCIEMICAYCSCLPQAVHVFK
jgi:hypothetical protein